MSKDLKQQDIILSEADKQVILEGKIPLARERFEALMNAIKLQLDIVHGETDSYMIWYEDYEKGNLARPNPPLEVGMKGRKKTIATHNHVSDTDRALGTPHDAWHYLNDVYISVVEFEHSSEEEPVKTPSPQPVKGLKPLSIKKKKIL